MLIPIRTSRELKRRPRVTGALVVANMVIHLLALVLVGGGSLDHDRLIELGALSRTDFKPWTLLTYQFLHDQGSIWHLAFNMLFLWVFGAPVEDRLGRVGFASFYLAGGVAAGLAHVAWSAAPVIGASGAVAAVTGAFAALAPRARVLVLVFFFIIGTFAVPALWFVAFYVAIDFLRSVGDLLGGGSRVAYVAHLAGYAFGFGVAVALLATRKLPRDDFDIWFIFKQSRRRAAFRRATSGSVAGPWESASADTGRRLGERARKTAPVDDAPPPDPEVAAARRRIEELVVEHRLPEAAEAYAELLAEHPETVLTADRQVDVASQLHAEGREQEAGTAYELMIDRYPAHPRTPEVRLLLAALYVRSLGRAEDALPLLERARSGRLGEDHRALVDALEAEAQAAGVDR